MMNLQAIDQSTELCIKHGVRVLNANLFGKTEAAHVDRLLELIDPPHGAVILDAGCGIGEVARLMAHARPDLEFQLLNVSAAQLAHCPDGMARILADFEATGLPDASVDVVMFNYSLCHSLNVPAALHEARRVLREGGILFVNDMVRTAGDNRLCRPLFESSFHWPDHLAQWNRQAGFDVASTFVHAPVVQRLRDIVTPALYDQVYFGTEPVTLRSIKRTLSDPVASAFARHERVAFQFSGGRDSTAALYLLRPYWHLMTVYHLDTGDQFPETREVVERVNLDVPIVRIVSDVRRDRAEHGLPTDLLPVDNTATGRMVSGRGVGLQSRYECCWRSLMQPMHQRMFDDGITLIIRGQRDDDYATPPKRSGAVGDGFELLYPIQDWNTGRVQSFLEEHALPISDFYAAGAPHGSDCMGCTAWWDDGRLPVLRRHPQAFAKYRADMKTIRIEINHQLSMLDEGE